jgi:hypothetical protein
MGQVLKEVSVMQTATMPGLAASPQTIARETQAHSTAPPQTAAPPWWTLLSRHLDAPRGSAELVELKITQLKHRHAVRQVSDAEFRAQMDDLAVELLTALFPTIRLEEALSHVEQVPGTGKLPKLALYPIGNRDTCERTCHIQTQRGALSGRVRDVEFETWPALMGIAAGETTLRKAYTGKEAETLSTWGGRVNWKSVLVGQLPEQALNVIGSLGLLEAESGSGPVGGGTITIGGQTVELPERTTGELLGPAGWTAELDDPSLLIVVPHNGETLYFLHADYNPAAKTTKTALNFFRMVT